jgi:hypothetical protein
MVPISGRLSGCGQGWGLLKRQDGVMSTPSVPPQPCSFFAVSAITLPW